MIDLQAAGLLLDADVLIDIARGRPAAAMAWFESLPDFPPVCGIAAMELIHGCRNGVELRQAQAFLRPFPLLWPTAQDLNRALSLYSPLKLAHGIGLNDCMIAATAVGAGLPLATFNIKHFRHVPGLMLVQPYVR
jgi:predicted nucleic acid-binding protein